MIRTWFNQPARKIRRRQKRAEKAKRSSLPMLVPLRPIVRGQSIKYNMKKKLGRGFTYDELKSAGISSKLARNLGIAVDRRRRNRSAESLSENTSRLKEYSSKLVRSSSNPNELKARDTNI